MRFLFVLTAYEYYKDPNVRVRLAEYCGGTPDNTDSFKCEYLVGYGKWLLDIGHHTDHQSVKNHSFNGLLERGLDILRSIWSRNVTLGILDVEYFNMDYGGNVYLKPRIVFEKLEPIYNLITKIYKENEIKSLRIMTGQGYHFSTLIENNKENKDSMYNKLVGIGHLEESLIGKYNDIPSNRGKKRDRQVLLDDGKAFDGMGKLLEYLTHEIIRRSQDVSELPVVISDVAVGRGKYGREGVSLDLTAHADPLFMRDIRLPFSTHQKHKVQINKVGNEIANSIPIQIVLPRNDLSLDEMFEMRRHFRNAANYAAKVSTKIPDAEDGWRNVYEKYIDSKLYEFHKEFDFVQHDHWTRWPEGYDKTNLDDFPKCIRHAIENPNSELLKPSQLQPLVRAFLKEGWHPKHIAGFLRSKYERDYGWGNVWNKYDASTRANWWARTYAGMVITGVDEGVDQNCISHQEKGMCSWPGCGMNLANFNPVEIKV